MNKNIRKIYISVLNQGYSVKVERIKDGIYGISLYKKMSGNWYAGTGTGPWTDRKFFYLYPRNPYTGEFVDE